MALNQMASFYREVTGLTVGELVEAGVPWTWWPRDQRLAWLRNRAEQKRELVAFAIYYTKEND